MSRLKFAVNSPHTRPWLERIGKIILNFSALEFESIHWLVQLSEQHQSIGTFVAMPFTGRTNQLKRHIEERSTSKRWRVESLRAWSDAVKLIKIRNRVAHNPIMFAWNNPDEAGEPDFVGIPSMRNPGSLDKDLLLSKAKIDQSTNEMVELAKKLERLRVEWCELRDKGQAPAVRVEPTRRYKVKLHLTKLLDATFGIFRGRDVP